MGPCEEKTEITTTVKKKSKKQYKKKNDTINLCSKRTTNKCNTMKTHSSLAEHSSTRDLLVLALQKRISKNDKKPCQSKAADGRKSQVTDTSFLS